MATLSACAADYFAGRFPAAVTLLDRAARLFRERVHRRRLGARHVPGLRALVAASTTGEFAELSSRFQALDQEARERGDRYMESTLGTYPGVLARLAADQPGEARELGEGAIAQWSQHGFHVQHLTHYYGNTYIDLYEGDGEAAWRRAERTWPEIRASLLPRIQHVKVDVLQLRGRSAVAAAAQARDPGPLLLAAEGVRPAARPREVGMGPGGGDPDPGGRLLDPRRRGPMQAAPGRRPRQGRGRAPRALRRRRPASARLALWAATRAASTSPAQTPG